MLHFWTVYPVVSCLMLLGTSGVGKEAYLGVGGNPVLVFEED